MVENISKDVEQIKRHIQTLDKATSMMFESIDCINHVKPNSKTSVDKMERLLFKTQKQLRKVEECNSKQDIGAYFLIFTADEDLLHKYRTSQELCKTTLDSLNNRLMKYHMDNSFKYNYLQR